MAVRESLEDLVVAFGYRQAQCSEIHARIQGVEAFSVIKKRADGVTAASYMYG